MNIKIRGKVYEIKQGDYIWFNGSAYGFTPKDKSIIPLRGFIQGDSLFPSKKEITRVLKEYKYEIVENRYFKKYIFS